MVEEVIETNVSVKEAVVVVEGVSKKFKDFTALDSVSFQVERNSIFGLLGSNGAGKSTMMNILTGLLNPTEGDISILGERVKKKYSRNLKRKVAIVPQEISLYSDLTVKDNLRFFGKAYGLRNKELGDRISFLTNILQLGDLNIKIRHLSGGYQRRVSLAVALIGNPEILILDEALVGIDLETKKIILDLLLNLKQQKTIIFTTHAMDEAEHICDYVCFFHRGRKIKEGKTNEIIEEFSRSHGSKIIVTCRNEEFADKMVRSMANLKSANVSREGRIVTITSISSEYDLSNAIRFLEAISNYKAEVVDLYIAKPTLGDIMLNLISDSRT